MRPPRHAFCPRRNYLSCPSNFHVSCSAPSRNTIFLLFLPFLLSPALDRLCVSSRNRSLFFSSFFPVLPHRSVRRSPGRIRSLPPLLPTNGRSDHLRLRDVPLRCYSASCAIASAVRPAPPQVTDCGFGPASVPSASVFFTGVFFGFFFFFLCSLALTLRENPYKS